LSCYIDVRKFWQQQKDLLEDMETTNDIGVEEGFEFSLVLHFVL
jgi:hypothetical protein